MWDIILIGLSVVCLAIGLVGSLVPLLPGPPMAYVGVLFLQATDKVQFSATQLVVWLVAVVVLQVLDYFIPMLGSKYSGGSKWGNGGCIVGTFLGLFFLPWGVVVGPFVGAVVGELLGDRTLSQALRAGTGSLIGFLAGTLLKVVMCGYFCAQCIIALLSNVAPFSARI